MTILVVDDETDMKALFEQRFRHEVRNGTVELAFAESAFTALDYLAQHGSKDVLILSDINMPGMSGLEMLRTIRATYTLPSPPVIMMLIAYGSSVNSQQAMHDGANDFLTKPLDFVQLKDKLTSFMSCQPSGNHTKYNS